MSSSPDPFNFSGISGPRSTPVMRRRKSAWQGPIAFGGGMLAVFLIGVLSAVIYSRYSRGRGPAVGLRPVPNQQIEETKTLQLTLTAQGEATPGGWRFELAQGPVGAELDPQTGVFSWTPTEAQGPGWYDAVVWLVDAGSAQTLGQVHFGIGVLESTQPPVITPIPEQTTDSYTPLAITVEARDPDDPAKPLKYRLASGGPEGASIDGDTGEFHWRPGGAEPGSVVSFTVAAIEAVPGGLTTKQQFQVRVTAPKPGATQMAATPVAETGSPSGEMPTPPPAAAKPQPAAESTEKEKEKPAASETPTETAPSTAGDETILALHDKNKLFHPAEYPTLRKIFADRFEQKHQEDIRQAFGDDYQAIREWLAAEPEIREELYTAIDPELDDVRQALTVFKDLQKQFSSAFPSYADLAIATAVTWDDGKGIYEYTFHQQRTRSTAVDGEAGAAENFRYFLEAEKVMQGRAQFLPWEILAYVVNHRTPLAERQWALLNYLPKRAMIGTCYSDVPYDTEMLVQESRVARLQGKPYTLPNIRQYGGVCAMQADFASRVAKSLGVPAAYVSGESTFGEPHAWVMWVELAGVNKNSINFNLQSHGRYRGDKYYVGNLMDPQTGAKITDREMELRLYTVGMNPKAKRHSDLIMACYPMIRDALKLDVAGQLAFLNQVIKLCPGNEQAWLAMAKMSRDGQIAAMHHKAMMVTLDSLFRTFANFPDFTWKIFDDLISFQDNQKQRAKLYERLVALYEAADRPDLACEAKLKYVEYLVADDRKKEAIQTLAVSIQRVPSEGRYVPRMLDRMEALCKEAETSQNDLVRFYQEFLPKIPQMRDDRPSPYCIEMFERGVQRFQEAGQEQLAKACEAQLALIKAGRGKRN